MKLEKGSLVNFYEVWHVVVALKLSLEDQRIYICCVDDHANNIHFFDISQIDKAMSLEEYVDFYEEREDDTLISPDINRVITEVFAGVHDKRFGEL